MTVIAEAQFDIADSEEKLLARLHAPEFWEASGNWSCRFEVSGALETSLEAHGTSSLQALALGLKGLSATVYALNLFRSGRLGIWGEFGRDLGIPAPSTYQDFAPFPF